MKISTTARFTALLAIGGISLVQLVNASPLPISCTSNECDEKLSYKFVGRGVETSTTSTIPRIDTIPLSLVPRLPPPRIIPDESPVVGRPSVGVGGGPELLPSGGTFGGGNGPSVPPPRFGQTDPAPAPAPGRPAPGTGNPALIPEAPAGPAVAASKFDDPLVETVRVDGQNALRGLDDAIKNKTPDQDKGAVLDPARNQYVKSKNDDVDDEDGPLSDGVGSGKPEYLDDVGIKAGPMTNWENSVITNTGPDARTILDYSVSVDQKTFILKQADIRQDVNRAGLNPGDPVPQNVMKTRDMMYDGWRTAAGGDPDKVKTLEKVVVDNITNPPTSAGIDAAFAKTGKDTTQMQTFTPSITDANELAAFQQISGTPFGQGITKMLAEHHNELGDLKVTSVKVWTDLTDVKPGYYAAVFNFGH